MVIDFGGYETVWTEADYNEVSDASELLLHACELNRFDCILDEEGKPASINGVADGDDASWGLWYVPKGGMGLVRSDDLNLDAADCTGISWAYTADDAEPAVIVDASGRSIYGYPQAMRTVTLSPSATEIMGALGAINTIFGADYYSNYPSHVAEGKASGEIATVGTYIDPNFESIMSTSPDMVVCDGSQYNHVAMAEKLRSSDTNSVLLYNGEGIDMLIDNIFIVGVAIGYELGAQAVIGELDHAVGRIIDAIGGDLSDVDTMLSLSSDPSPWISGDNTYIDDILLRIGGINAFDSMEGWVHINSEYVARHDPSLIIILSEEIPATEDGYNAVMVNLSAEWKSTTAYKTGEIYVFGDSLGNMAQLSGPRFAQMMELMAIVLYPECFGDGSGLPKHIGDDYQDYLTITTELGFDSR